MIEQFTDVKFQRQVREKLYQVENICNEYSKLTLRQLYYQLVSRGIIPNNTKEYGKLSYLLTKARMGGIIDWDIIEDRTRSDRIPYWVYGIRDALQDTIDFYRLDRMKGQENYIEVWVEKDALSGVLYEITKQYHIRLIVNKGYSSTTFMHNAYQRIGRNNNPCILYIGDHDPSGLDMVRDIGDRLLGFGVTVSVEHIALTMDQIQEYNPPPNPAKMTDTRAKEYVAIHGNSSWEVDALPPDVLNEILEDRILELIDESLYKKIMESEKRDIEKMREFVYNNLNEDDE